MRVHVQIISVTVLLAAICAVRSETADEENKRCVNSKMDQCNKKVKNAFIQGGKAEDLTDLEVYCNAMKVLFQCVKLQIQEENPCRSKMLRKYHFIVLSYLRMDKLMSICTLDVQPDTERKVLEDPFTVVPEIDQFKEFRQLAFEDTSPAVSKCAIDAHKVCVKQLTGSEKQSQDLCNGVSNFIRCYQASTCTNRLSVTFATLIKQMSSELIQAFQINSMCEDKSEL